MRKLEAAIPAAEAKEWILNKATSEPFSLSIGELLEQYCELRPELNNDQASCNTQFAKQVLRLINDYVDDWCSLTGHTPIVTRLATDPDYLISYFRITLEDDTETALRKRWLSLLPIILERLHKLSPQDFEELCARALTLSGIAVNPTPLSHDKGIDFCGSCTIKPSHIPTLTKYLQKRIKIIGQAKRISPNVVLPPSAIRELIGAKEPSNAPILLTLVSTSRFSSESWKLGRDLEIILFDGQLFSEFLVDLLIHIERKRLSKEKTPSVEFLLDMLWRHPLAA